MSRTVLHNAFYWPVYSTYLPTYLRGIRCTPLHRPAPVTLRVLYIASAHFHCTVSVRMEPRMHTQVPGGKYKTAGKMLTRYEASQPVVSFPGVRELLTGANLAPVYRCSNCLLKRVTHNLVQSRRGVWTRLLRHAPLAPARLRDNSLLRFTVSEYLIKDHTRENDPEYRIE